MASPAQPPPIRPIAEPVDFRVEAESFAPDGLVVTVAGELDIATVPQVRKLLNAALAGGARRVVIDLRPLFFLDSVAVAALLRIAAELGDDGRLAVVVDPDSYIWMVFEIAGLPQCLDVVETREEALARIAG